VLADLGTELEAKKLELTKLQEEKINKSKSLDDEIDQKQRKLNLLKTQYKAQNSELETLKKNIAEYTSPVEERPGSDIETPPAETVEAGSDGGTEVD
jgi:TolA-binding protein